MPAVLFRCDGGPELGIGHLVRCRALAAAFDALGWRSAFAVSRETATYVSGLAVVIVPPGVEGAGAVAAATYAEKFDSLIVDHYGLDAAFETAARGNAALVMAIDDLANRPHHCDVLLDANPERTVSDYRRLVEGSHLLLGLKHALLRPEFAQRRPAVARAPRRRIERLLVVLGGSDPGLATEHMLQALPGLCGIAAHVTLVIGPANPRRGTLASKARSLGASAVVDPPNLLELMMNADMAITSGSTTCLELACLGVPALILVTVENQRALARAVSRAGAGQLLGECRDVAPEQIVGAAAALDQDEALRGRMGDAGRNLVDGQGSRRVAGFIADMLSVKQREMHS
jgi:UDP-2,4-diacetamido-2,4,6-trideoxy-beta-L-altropyranose hydrolase